MMSFMGYWAPRVYGERPLDRPSRTMPSASLTKRGPAVALALLIVAVTVGTLVYPTYPNYDSYYSLIWGRELRSEEHTSELQSLTNLVCRLLLEKKNQIHC